MEWEWQEKKIMEIIKVSNVNLMRNFRQAAAEEYTLPNAFYLSKMPTPSQ